MIYGREKGKGKFMPFTGEGFTDKVIYALRWAPDQGEKVQTIVEHLNEDNPSFEFEARRGKGSMFSTPKTEKPWLKRAKKPEPCSPECIAELIEIGFDEEDMEMFLAENPQFTMEDLQTRRHVMQIFKRWWWKMPHWEWTPDRKSEPRFCPFCLAYVQPSNQRGIDLCPICGMIMLAGTLSEGIGREAGPGPFPVVMSDTNVMDIQDCRTDRADPDLEFVREYRDGVPQGDCIMLNRNDYADYEAEFDRQHRDAPDEWRLKNGCQTRYVNGAVAYTKTNDPKKVQNLNRNRRR